MLPTFKLPGTAASPPHTEPTTAATTPPRATERPRLPGCPHEPPLHRPPRHLRRAPPREPSTARHHEEAGSRRTVAPRFNRKAAGAARRPAGPSAGRPPPPDVSTHPRRPRTGPRGDARKPRRPGGSSAARSTGRPGHRDTSNVRGFVFGDGDRDGGGGVTDALRHHEPGPKSTRSPRRTFEGRGRPRAGARAMLRPGGPPVRGSRRRRRGGRGGGRGRCGVRGPEADRAGSPRSATGPGR